MKGTDKQKLRQLLLFTFLIGSIGSFVELLLLEHTEDYWQFVPIILIVIGVILVIIYEIKPARKSLTIFRITMILFILSGFIGMWQHYQGNVEFEKEMYPSMEGLELFWEAMKGATPALAPGTMIGLGLVGWAYAFVKDKKQLLNLLASFKNEILY